MKAQKPVRRKTIRAIHISGGLRRLIMAANSFGIKENSTSCEIWTSLSRHKKLGALPQSILRRSMVKLSCTLSEPKYPERANKQEAGPDFVA